MLLQIHFNVTRYAEQCTKWLLQLVSTNKSTLQIDCWEHIKQLGTSHMNETLQTCELSGSSRDEEKLPL